MLGLFGQAAAYAAGAHARAPAMPAVVVSQMDGDCVDMMQKEEPSPAQKPCKGLTLDCIAAMGCVVPFLLKEPLLVAAPRAISALHYWPATSHLAGGIIVPEPHPPAVLG